MSLPLIRPDWPAPKWVQAVSTTRLGGISTGPYSALNLGAACGDTAACVNANRRRLERACGAQYFWLEQNHGIRCIELEEPDRRADASWTRQPARACAILTADCLPILLCHQSERLVAAVHAGWRGLAAGVVEATLAALDCRPRDMLAWLGPCIGPRQFEVGEDVYTAFVAACIADQDCFAPARPGKWLADLPALARARLQRAGLAQIFSAAACTVSAPEKFFSYRRDTITGRMATGIWLACE